MWPTDRSSPRSWGGPRPAVTSASPMTARHRVAEGRSVQSPRLPTRGGREPPQLSSSVPAGTGPHQIATGSRGRPGAQAAPRHAHRHDHHPGPAVPTGFRHTLSGRARAPRRAWSVGLLALARLLGVAPGLLLLAALRAFALRGGRRGGRTPREGPLHLHAEQVGLEQLELGAVNVVEQRLAADQDKRLPELELEVEEGHDGHGGQEARAGLGHLRPVVLVHGHGLALVREGLAVTLAGLDAHVEKRSEEECDHLRGGEAQAQEVQGLGVIGEVHFPQGVEDA
mmetsp:Transcript_22167/g.74575  ORF Transcript_22167/g.74575 Transcript_22167/m.74575 type:complete len:283 (+) Transcript_22167:245-1093(+)